MDVVKTIALTGFDPQGDPEIRVLADGTLYVVFNFMPPSDFEDRDMGPYHDFDAQLSAAAGVPVRAIEDFTGFPEMMDGRVKTLHPKVHGGLLAIRGDSNHAASMKAHGIAPIDLLVVNLYPFEQTVAKGAGFDECIENIDIGGPAMIRSAAKNHASVAVLTAPEHYEAVLAEISEP